VENKVEKTSPDPKAREIRTLCPVCRKTVVVNDLKADKRFPFCSDQCKLVDLGKWFDGEYSLEAPLEDEEE
jgi:uncharacterized protein